MIARIHRLFKHHPIKILLLLVWLCLLFFSDSVQYIAEYGLFLLLGLVGAIFANATGAGGGVVFVPFFSQLSLSNETIVATSFAIQCCGMTAGAITWYRYYLSLNSNPKHQLSKDTQQAQWQHLPKSLLISVPFSIIGLLIAQFFLSEYTKSIQQGLHFYFGMFSVVLAFAIYFSIPIMKRQTTQFTLQTFDIALLAIIAFFGGIITAWISVGVGELVAVYLILRGFNVSFAIAVAVILSALSVQAAIFYHLFISEAIYFQIVLFAGAGAIAGGFIAKHVVLAFSPIRLKIFFGTWVLVMGLAGLI